ncbi:MAG TPA: phosphate ABC transporter substrate-binding protein [Candidatus Limnocylindria bacterium]|nr:phosphate ABC transporter substrate-binding protein [Candidatus Limnocylindria bacterium]
MGLLMAVGLAHCGGRRAAPVTIKGSDTMVILGQRWAEGYMAAHPGAVIQVTGGGSGTGIAALINGTTDICQSSRPMKDDEKQQLNAKYGQPPQEIMVAKDGLAVYVQEQNPVRELTIQQIKDIYTGAVTNWKAVGGADVPITAYGRENNSGTYVYFKEHVLNDADFAAAIQTLPGTAAVVNAVAQDPNGIGYGGAAYAKGVREVGIKSDAAGAAVLPTAENVKSGAYPISRGLFYYMRQAPTGAVKEFIDYVLSAEGQKVVTEVGYFPIQ